jgi:Xaa-Pro aminopeptidase
MQAIVGYGETTLADPDLTYVVGGTLPRGGFYFRKVDRPPLLIVSNIDLGSARRLGKVRRIETLTLWGYEGLRRKHRDRSEANAHLIASVLEREGVKGKVALFGRNDLSVGLHLARIIRRLGIDLIGERPPTVLEAARDIKDKGELQSLRNVAKSTGAVVNDIVDSLRNAREKRGHLHVGNKRATVGLIKSLIASKLGEQGVVAPEGTIFATGSSGADPHNAGAPAAEIRKGRLIVFDIFPQAMDGYWCDLTRTFVVGRADRKARKMFETVHQAQADVLDHLTPGVTGESAMELACAVIGRAGFNTLKQVFEGKSNNVSTGFIHGLGHGVGLTIGESPYLGFASKGRLKSGEVVTVEPGIYLPGYGGVRIEDTVIIKSKGIENLGYVEKELELS